jgi:serine/threonine-protein kinase
MVGQRIIHYEIVDRLGAGGMGEVYLAQDTRLGRNVALKILPEMFAADDERVARFEREARVLASLNHPNIAALYGLERAEGKSFLVMELVEGQTLAERITRGPIPVEEALKIACQMAQGLETAHEKGIVHRDLKPRDCGVYVAGAGEGTGYGRQDGYLCFRLCPLRDAGWTPKLSRRYGNRGHCLDPRA